MGVAAVAVARKAYATEGLENNPKKGFCDAQLATFWGVEVDGDKGILRAASARLWPAMMMALQVATLKLATVGLLEALAGTWVSLLGVRRRLFCLLDIVFEALAMEDQKTVIHLSPELVDGLVSVVCMAPIDTDQFAGCLCTFPGSN